MSDVANVAPEPDGVEITPEMIEAGFTVLSASGITDDPLEADKLLVSRIYQAMFELRPRKDCERNWG
jgi:hypothetical protein